MNTTKQDFLSPSFTYGETVETYLSILEKKEISERGRVMASIALREKNLIEPNRVIQALLENITASDEPVDLRRHCLVSLHDVLSKHGKTCAINNGQITSELIPLFENNSFPSAMYWPLVHILSRLGYEKLVPVLASWVCNHADNDYRDAIYDLEFLAKQGVNAAWQALVDLIMDDHLSSCARGQAVVSMKSIKDFHVIPYLKELLSDPDIDPYLANDIQSTIETLFQLWQEVTGSKQHLVEMFEQETGLRTALFLSKDELGMEENKGMPKPYPSPVFQKSKSHAFV